MSQRSLARRTSLRDVAARAGVSVMTVSNVVNGKSARVSDDVRKRVLDAIAVLNYRPQLRGRSLRLARDFAIGLIILHPERRFLNDPFYTEVAAGMSNQLARDGYGLMVIGAQGIADLKTKLARISQLDAIAVLGFGDRAQRRADYQVIADLGVPLMLIGDDLVDGLPDASFVRQENEAAARALATLVLENGARHILFVRPEHVWPAMTQRERGVRAACAGRAVVETAAFSEIDFAVIVAALRDRLQAAPGIDAVMGGNDLFGIAALHAAGQIGRAVPADLIVTGFNGFEFRDFSSPLLTSMRSPAYDIGSEAARRLVHRIATGGFDPVGKVFDVTLMPGATLGRLAKAP